MYNIKDRLAVLKMSQVGLLKALRDRGIDIQPPQLCNIVNGNYTYPKATRVLEMCNTIITEVENARDST